MKKVRPTKKSRFNEKKPEFKKHKLSKRKAKKGARRKLTADLDQTSSEDEVLLASMKQNFSHDTSEDDDLNLNVLSSYQSN